MPGAAIVDLRTLFGLAGRAPAKKENHRKKTKQIDGGTWARLTN